MQVLLFCSDPRNKSTDWDLVKVLEDQRCDASRKWGTGEICRLQN